MPHVGWDHDLLHVRVLLQLWLCCTLSVSDYYPFCEIQFMSLANIHTIRKSFQAIRNLCTLAVEQPG